MKKYIINKDTDTSKLASIITGNSEIFGDEIMSVEAELNTLRQYANKYGCAMEGTINNFYGGVVKVTAFPAVKRHSWSF